LHGPLRAVALPRHICGPIELIRCNVHHHSCCPPFLSRALICDGALSVSVMDPYMEYYLMLLTSGRPLARNAVRMGCSLGRRLPAA
jgi:hypothetical protein